jgi:hypothetical protein
MPLLIATAITIIGIYVVFSVVLNQVFDHVFNAFFA